MYPHTFALELTQSSDYISFCPFACLSKALSGLIPIHGCVWATEIITSSESNIKPVIYLSIFLYIITPVLLVLTSSLFEQSSSSLTNYLRWLSSRSYKSDWLHPAIFKRTSVHIVGTWNFSSGAALSIHYQLESWKGVSIAHRMLSIILKSKLGGCVQSFRN